MGFLCTCMSFSNLASPSWLACFGGWIFLVNILQLQTPTLFSKRAHHPSSTQKTTFWIVEYTICFNMDQKSSISTTSNFLSASILNKSFNLHFWRPTTIFPGFVFSMVLSNVISLTPCKQSAQKVSTFCQLERPVDINFVTVKGPLVLVSVYCTAGKECIKQFYQFHSVNNRFINIGKV